MPAVDSYFITTPIYYVNDVPHLGHAYTTIAADVITRYKKLNGYETFFLTGTDEHGQKVQEAAKHRKVEPQAHVDEYVKRFETLWDRLHIQNDDFIRTSEPRDRIACSAIWHRLFDNGQIYLGSYAGWYAVRDEAFSVSYTHLTLPTNREV